MLTGVVRPDRESRLRPAQVTNSAINTDALSALMLKPPKTTWPLDNDPGAKRALRYLGNANPQLGPDPRSAYWTQSWDQSDTGSIRGDIAKVPYPAGEDFTSAQFDAAKAQLDQELKWVGNVRSYMTKLASPYGPNAALTAWKDAQTIADTIYESANSPDKEAAFKWLELTEAILELFGPATHEVTGTIAAAMEIAAWVYGATNEGAPTAEEINIKAHEFGAELVEHAQQQEATFRRIGDAIVSDPDKLSLLGEKGGCNPSSPQCPKEFAFSEADRVAASVDVYRGFEKESYLELLPLEYHVMALTRQWERGRQRERPAPPWPGDYQCSLYFPWSGYEDLPRASGDLLQEVDMTGRDHGWDTFVLSAPSATDVHGSPPSVRILKRMFDPVSESGDPRAGGLNISWNHLTTHTTLDYWYHSKASEDLHCRWWN
jgi:hypothetical protein